MNKNETPKTIADIIEIAALDERVIAITSGTFNDTPLS